MPDRKWTKPIIDAITSTGGDLASIDSLANLPRGTTRFFLENDNVPADAHLIWQLGDALKSIVFSLYASETVTSVELARQLFYTNMGFSGLTDPPNGPAIAPLTRILPAGDSPSFLMTSQVVPVRPAGKPAPPQPGPGVPIALNLKPNPPAPLGVYCYRLHGKVGTADLTWTDDAGDAKRSGMIPLYAVPDNTGAADTTYTTTPAADTPHAQIGWVHLGGDSGSLSPVPVYGATDVDGGHLYCVDEERGILEAGQFNIPDAPDFWVIP